MNKPGDPTAVDTLAGTRKKVSHPLELRAQNLVPEAKGDSLQDLGTEKLRDAECGREPKDLARGTGVILVVRAALSTFPQNYTFLWFKI